jgi:CheY-like chemotaxis protein
MKKILLVDDSNTVLMMERMILGKCGYDLITAGDGVEALSKAQNDGPDLILMDVIMPRMGGLEAVQKLHQDRATASIPVIMVTTRSEIENVEAAFENGCAEYVTKPINGLELVTKVRSFLGE